jgi:hypothetical protein
MPITEVAIMALAKGREVDIGQQRMERARQLEELDALAKRTERSGRFGFLHDIGRLAAELAGRWRQPERRPESEAGEPVVLTVDRVGQREAGGRAVNPNQIAVPNRSSC